MKRIINSLIAAACLLPALGLAAPTVSLSAPANNAKYLQPATVTVSASATASSGTTLTQVEFYAGTTLIGTDTASPYSISWANVPAGVHSLTAKATDNTGAATTSAARTFTVSAANTAPTVSLSAPANNAKYLQPAAITVSATAKAPESNDTVAQVEFYAGTTLIGTDTASPYSISWANVPAGVHSLTAKATDGQGGVTTSAARTVTVNAENLPPTVSLSGPANNSTWVSPAAITVSANASGPEANDPVARVEFYAGASLIGTDTASPFSVSWASPPAGVHSLTAMAWDGQGAVTTSAVRTVTVSTGNVPPSVSLSAPADGSSYTAPASVTLSADATDSDGTIASVAFYNGATLIGSGTLAGGSYTFAWTNVPAGSYSLTARATDNQGAAADSAAVAVTVSEPAPPPVTVGVYYVYADHLNTPRVITDASNRIVWRWDSDPFGASTANEDPDGDGAKFTYNLRFPGQYYDRETSLHYNYFRDYDPSTGRYVQSDPIGLEGGPNVYAYVEGNPVSYVDPEGLMGYGSGAAGNRPYQVVTGNGDASICGYYDAMAIKYPSCDYYKEAANICRGQGFKGYLTNSVVKMGINAAAARRGGVTRQSDILNGIRARLIAADQKNRQNGNVDGNGCVCGNTIDSYHNDAFRGVGVDPGYYGGNKWPQSVWPNPVPLDPSVPLYDPRRLWQ